MNETMGQIIRRLRKERDLTQEELAELLNVSNQAVSKWERDESMPDISQVVPLANVFGVTTDVLFGMSGTDGSEEACRIVREANELELQEYGNTASFLAAYEMLVDEIRKHPTNLILLNNCVGKALSLCLPENGSMYIPERADEIAAETERQAKRILMFSNNASDVMRAHQILVYLYSSRGEFDKAEAEADCFPERVDFTYHSHHARVAEMQKDWDRMIRHLRQDIHWALQTLEDAIVQMGKAYFSKGLYVESIETYECWFRIIHTVCDGKFPPYHDFDSGDCYLLLAEAYLALGDTDKAMENVENSVHYWLGTRSCTPSSSGRCSRILIDDWWYGCPDDVLKVKLTGKLESPTLDPLRDCERFRALIEEVSSL
ncbi:MAG: helix-turn-helix transcriptional regulator [Clostridia bacterium]|nr:helix-turn-helix transcriptional regulator [Clostridia bacterium]